MAWERITKAQRGKTFYGEDWTRVPCVAINKGGITLNKPFLDAFVPQRCAICIHMDREKRLIGVKVPGPQDEDDNFRLSSSKGSGNKEGTAKSASCTAIPKAFPDAVGRAYRAHMNPGERIIEIELSPDNRIR